jgi:hypothetical protein
MFHTLNNIVYWIALIGIICIITYVILWRYFHITINRKIISSILTGAIGGGIIFFLIQKQPAGAPLLTISFIEILFLTGMAAGVLAILLGGILKTSHDLSIIGLIIGSIFSLLSIFGVVYRDSVQGKFLALTSSYVLDKVPLFVFFFLVSFFASLGAGSLFIQYVLQETIDNEIS